MQSTPTGHTDRSLLPWLTSDGLQCKQQFISIEDKWTAEAQRTREAGEDLNPEVITANPTKEEEEMREI